MRIVLTAAVAVAALALQQPASATIVAITVTGTVSFGLDNVGLFGAVGQNLRDAAYRMDFAYDISNAVDLGSSRQANGGTAFNRPSPIVRANVTINGVTASAIDPYSATYDRFIGPNFSEVDFGAGGPNGINGGGLSWRRADQLIPLALDAPITRVFDSSDTVFSAFQRANAQLTVFSYIQLRPVSITIAPEVAAVPEPGSWALMITGFGLVGIAARRRVRIRVA